MSLAFKHIIPNVVSGKVPRELNFRPACSCRPEPPRAMACPGMVGCFNSNEGRSRGAYSFVEVHGTSQVSPPSTSLIVPRVMPSQMLCDDARSPTLPSCDK